ncbi:sensor histidine kinase [Paenibacillus sp. YN15]|uniref:sensor histidine kinase n=1 Tax=Paenibacillus sp. YN15 TaxID=1742774 RepID=UPI00215CD612|nr:sensor histidine kinase [Paenibacillus sp. YN15]
MGSRWRSWARLTAARRGKRSIQAYMTTVFTAIIIIAMLAVGLVLHSKFSRTAEESAYLNTEQIVEQVNFNVEYYLRGMEELFRQLDDRVSKSASLSGRETLEQLATIVNTRNDLVSVSVFAEDGRLLTGYPHTQLRENVDVIGQRWFAYAADYPNYLQYSPPHVQNLYPGEYRWVVSLSQSVSIRENGGERVEAVMLLDVNFRAIDDMCRRVALGKKGYIYITDPDGNLIYHPEQQLIYLGLKEEPNAAEVMNYSYGSFYDRQSGERRLVHVKTVKNIGWKIVGVAYMDELVTSAREISTFMVWFLVVVILFVVGVSAYMSAVVSKPIKQLGQSMKSVERGDFDSVIAVAGTREVEQLSQRYNLMLGRIRELMRENEREQEAKRKSELEVLQAQINPHFLYNTLNSVVRLAEGGRNSEVVTMITSLSRLFRISLSKGKNMIPLQDELEHIRHYLIIQNIRFKNKFRFTIEAEEAVLSCLTLKLILQPLVENSIQHGIEMMQDEGEIRVAAGIADDKLLITVTDNGLGMPEEVLAHILDRDREKAWGRDQEKEASEARGSLNASVSARKSSGSGVGVRNVHERIRLTFGEPYGLEFASRLEEGTTVKVWLPLLSNEAAGEGEKP